MSSAEPDATADGCGQAVCRRNRVAGVGSSFGFSTSIPSFTILGVPTSIAVVRQPGYLGRSVSINSSMNYHVVSVRSRFIGTSIRSIHAAFFHGKAKLGGFYPTADDFRITHEPDTPLQLHKNVYKIGDIFAPEFELVVSNIFANRLAGIPNLELQPVKFGLLYNYPYEVGDLGCGFKTRGQPTLLMNRSPERSDPIRSPMEFQR